MVLFHNPTRPTHGWAVSHGFWAFVFVVGTLAGLAAYAYEAQSGAWPTGSSAGLFWTGVAAAVLMLFEFLLWPRRKLRAWRMFGSGLLWMKAHIWLGLLTFPLVLLHCGLYFRGWLANALMIVYLIVFLSGLYGLFVQQVLPRMMLVQVSIETIYSQIPRLVAFLRRDAAVLVRRHDPDYRLPELPNDPLAGDDTGLGVQQDRVVVVGAPRKIGSVHGKVFEAQITTTQLPNDDLVLKFFAEVVEPYLRPVPPRRHPLADAQRSIALFDEIRNRAAKESTETLARLEGLVDQRRQLSLQAWLHELLHSWLAIHVPLSVVLLVLLLAHIWVASVYSGFPWLPG